LAVLTSLAVLPFWLAEFSILTKAKKGLDVRMHEQQSA